MQPSDVTRLLWLVRGNIHAPCRAYERVRTSARLKNWFCLSVLCCASGARGRNSQYSAVERSLHALYRPTVLIAQVSLNRAPSFAEIRFEMLARRQKTERDDRHRGSLEMSRREPPSTLADTLGGPLPASS